MKLQRWDTNGEESPPWIRRKLGRILGSRSEQLGESRMLMGCLIKHSTQRWGQNRLERFCTQARRGRRREAPTSAHYNGKDLTEVRNPQRKLAPDTVVLEQREPTSLWDIAQRAKACKDHRFQDLYRMLDTSLLLSCWDDLNKRSASGVDEVTAADYEQDLIGNILRLEERLLPTGSDQAIVLIQKHKLLI